MNMEIWNPDTPYDTLLILATLGLPGSGKSYWAKQFVKDNPNFVRVNKDDIRVAMRKEKGKAEDVRVNESEVIARETDLILNALKSGKSVVSDNTHLNPSHIKERYPRLINENNLYGKVKVVVKSFLDVPFEVCVERDKGRSGIESVGFQVIERMWKEWRSHWEPKDFDKYNDRLVAYQETKALGENVLPKAVVFDLDGSMCLIGDRGRFEEHLVGKDLPNIPVVNVCKMYLQNPDYEVVFLSGRKEGCREQTTDWLESYLGVEKPNLYMRADYDNRSDDLVKEDLYREHLEPFVFVEAVYDDRLRVCRKWFELGIFVFNLNQTLREF